MFIRVLPRFPGLRIGHFDGVIVLGPRRGQAWSNPDCGRLRSTQGSPGLFGVWKFPGQTWPRIFQDGGKCAQTSSGPGQAWEMPRQAWKIPRKAWLERFQASRRLPQIAPGIFPAWPRVNQVRAGNFQVWPGFGQAWKSSGQGFPDHPQARFFHPETWKLRRQDCSFPSKARALTSAAYGRFIQVAAMAHCPWIATFSPPETSARRSKCTHAHRAGS